AIDGWSLAVLFADLTAAYEAALAGDPVTFAEPPVQYADFAVWDREVFAAPDAERHLAERVDKLLTVPGGLTLGERREPLAAVPGGARPGRRPPLAVPRPRRAPR